jgi:hypothetical protein
MQNQILSDKSIQKATAFHCSFTESRNHTISEKQRLSGISQLPW